MADRKAEQDRNQGCPDQHAPTNKYGVLRASTFSSSNNSEAGSFRSSQLVNNPFAIGSLSSNHIRSSNLNTLEGGKELTNKFILRPSPLQHQASLIKEPVVPHPQATNSFKLEPPKLFSPLSGKGLVTNEHTLTHIAIPGDQSKVDSNNEQSNNDDNKSNGEIGNCSIQNEDNESDEKNGLHLTTTTTTTSSSSSTTALTLSTNTSATEKFVFGSNLADRVVNIVVPTADNGGGGVDNDDRDNGLFSSAATTSMNNNNIISSSTITNSAAINNKNNDIATTLIATSTTATTTSLSSPPSAAACISLAESAAKQQQAKDVKPELKEVTVVTGEENESNVLQFNAKLHLFDKETQNWQERGRGLLRLNDMTTDDNDTFHSRLVMRAQGSLRVIMNVKLWAGMLVDRASHKSIKISAVDPDDGIKIYLITANQGDTEHLYNAVTSRTQRLKSTGGAKKEPSSPSPSLSSSPSCSLPKKRLSDVNEESCIIKKSRLESASAIVAGDESNDSNSAPYPDTEVELNYELEITASNEGFTSSSSPAVQSSSSLDP